MTTTNSAGVLAVLDAEIASAESLEISDAFQAERLPKLRQARAAVLELEKRGNALVGGARHREDGRWVVQREDFDAFRAALAALAGNGKEGAK